MKIFIKGLGTTNRKIMIAVYLWLINSAFSALIVAPLYFMFKGDFSRSLMGEKLLKGSDLLWLGDLLYKHRNNWPSLLGSLIVTSFLFLLLYIFLNGGILGSITSQEKKVCFSSFFSDCGKYFWRFLRVFLISIVSYAIIFLLLGKAISSLLKIWTKSASTEWPLILSSNLKFLLFILLFSLVRMFFDYVRIRLVVEKSRKAIRATLLTFSFLKKRFWKAWSLYLTIALISIFFLVIFLAVSSHFPGVMNLFLFSILWQQVYVFSRMWTKVLFFSTEFHLFIS